MRRLIFHFAAIVMALTASRCFADLPKVIVKYSQVTDEAEIGELIDGCRVFVDETFTLADIPDEAAGFQFARLQTFGPSDVTIQAASGSGVYLILDLLVDGEVNPALSLVERKGWKQVGELSELHAGVRTRLILYKQQFAADTTIKLNQNPGKSGYVVAARYVELEGHARPSEFAALSAKMKTSNLAPATEPQLNSDVPGVQVCFARGQTLLAPLKVGEPVLTAARWAITGFPAEMEGLTFTRREGYKACPVQITADAGTTVYVMAMRAQWGTERNYAMDSMGDAGWVPVYDNMLVDKEGPRMQVYKKSFSERRTVEIRDNHEYLGYLVAAKNLAIMHQFDPAASRGTGPTVAQLRSAPAVHVQFDKGVTALGSIDYGGRILTNRDSRITSIPRELYGLSITQREGGAGDGVHLTADSGATVYALLTRDVNGQENPAVKALAGAGWSRLTHDVVIDGKKNGNLAVFKRVTSEQGLLELPANSEWSGYLIASLRLTTGAAAGEGSAAKVAEDWPKVPDGFAPDSPVLQGALPGPVVALAKRQASIHVLEVEISKAGFMTGEASETVLTTLGGALPRRVSMNFVTPVGKEMRAARTEALRCIQVRYPNWNANGAELTFEDKYSLHEGGSIGAALGTLTLSLIQGFEIDPCAAITGDITANGRVIRIGGVYAKIHGAEASGCKVVALPEENFDQLLNTESFIGRGEVPKVQVIGVSNLDDAIAVVRVDRDPKLKEAITRYEQLQQQIEKSPGYLHDPKCIAQLNDILALSPQHFSAKLLLMLATNEQPKNFSAAASIYYTSVAARQMLPVLTERKNIGRNAVPSNALKHGMDALTKLRPKADPNVVPLIDAWIRFIRTFQSYGSGIATGNQLVDDGQAVDDQMARLQMNADLMQKELHDGI